MQNRSDDNKCNSSRFNTHSQNRGDCRGRETERGGSNRRGEVCENRSLPKLIPLVLSPLAEENTEPPQVAKQLVIGNLPPNIKEHNIYELVTKAKGTPLQINIKQINRPLYRTTHYAQVFLKDAIEMKEVIKGLEGLRMNGYELIVDSAAKLVQEGKKHLENQNVREW